MDKKQKESYFDGGFWELVGWSLLGLLVWTITVGIALPWIYCWFARWRTNHTVIDGKRLRFNGTGGSLFAHYILRGWLLGLILNPLTLGLYLFYYLFVSLKKWEIKNTSLVDSGNSSGFAGNDKKCRSCSKIFSGSYTACPHCGSSLYEEITEKVLPISPIANVGDDKRCRSCGKIFSGSYTACPYCGSSLEETTEKVIPISPIVNVGDSWVCKRCSERNPNTSSTCKGCGAYK